MRRGSRERKVCSMSSDEVPCFDGLCVVSDADRTSIKSHNASQLLFLLPGSTKMCYCKLLIIFQL